MTNTSTFEEELERNGILIYTNRGDSMMPLLRENRDLIHIRRVNGRCRKYDVPLYKRDSGQYVLHRILKVRKNDYVICGDKELRTGIFLVYWRALQGMVYIFRLRIRNTEFMYICGAIFFICGRWSVG